MALGEKLSPFEHVAVDAFLCGWIEKDLGCVFERHGHSVAEVTPRAREEGEAVSVHAVFAARGVYGGCEVKNLVFIVLAVADWAGV